MARLRWLKSGAHAALAVLLLACHFPGMEWRTGRPAKQPGIIEPCIPTRDRMPSDGTIGGLVGKLEVLRVE